MATFIKCDKCGDYVSYDAAYRVYVEKMMGSNLDSIYGKKNIDFCEKCAIELIDSCKEERK